MEFSRASGILFHPTSLPGPFGIGDLGSEAYKFVDALAAAGQKYWQILPLGPTGWGDSPYQCYSAFAGNTLLISPEKLRDEGLISNELLDHRPTFRDQRVDYGAVTEWKADVLDAAAAKFASGGFDELRAAFDTFCRENAFWLDDYALYRAARTAHGDKAWYEWPEDLRIRRENALNAARGILKSEIAAQKLWQFLFYREWRKLKAYAAEKGIKIIGDIPIFVALDSSDVWCNQSEFKLNADGSPKVVSGVPPDFFSSTGQLWGNPIYDWDAMVKDGFSWWVARIAWTLEAVDIVRIDHFRGFEACWEVPGKNKTAEHGEWVKAAGDELFSAVVKDLGHIPMIAEDLGFITPEVLALRDKYEIPGMRVLQFGFGGNPNDDHLPHRYVPHCVAYTGTHDNDTAVGWFNTMRKRRATSAQTALALKYLNGRPRSVNWDMIRGVWSSVADTAIAPMQDVLGLGEEARMNLPATIGSNWAWRMEEGAFSEACIARLAEMTQIYGRAG
ncbi:MAG: 4-alpha-glucanotransferase [Acidobacteria bacterium ACB1]|nr:4-alpha-glucanotransferase [Pyrinomonadaceae bacterium]MCE7962736.1 4-alpha-glucanotransferase [Acidobacteria bacterium ACB1]RIJ96294.1 MAG: 4-alpha-glucanotransferase [Acidobacteriota bacterium]